MGLRELAEADLGVILEDRTTGFGWNVTVTGPAGLSAPLVGFSDDIAQMIDPDTGELVSGRKASVALRLSSLTAAGFATLPRNVADASQKPWVVQFDDINGNAYAFKVREGDPDRTIGLIVCMLEAYS